MSQAGQPVTSSSTGVDAGASGGGTNLQQVLDLLSKIQDSQANQNSQLSSLTEALNKSVANMSSLTENMSKIADSISAQISNQATVFGAQDQFEWSRRDRTQFDQLQTIANAHLANTIANVDAMTKQYMQHNALAMSGMWGVPSAGAARAAGDKAPG